MIKQVFAGMVAIGSVSGVASAQTYISMSPPPVAFAPALVIGASPPTTSTTVERDRLTAIVGSRSGTPQDRHPHALLAGGLRALDEIFPGYADDLARASAVPVRVAQEVQFERPDFGVAPKRDFEISLLCASRPLIEFGPTVCHRADAANFRLLYRHHP